MHMSKKTENIQVKRVEAAFNPVQDQDLDVYGEELKKYTIVDVDVHVDVCVMLAISTRHAVEEVKYHEMRKSNRALKVAEFSTILLASHHRLQPAQARATRGAGGR